MDVPLETVSRGFSILEQRADAAMGPGGEKIAGAFERIGISAADLQSISDDPEKLFNAVQEGLSKVSSAEERSAVTKRLLGTAGRELIPIFQMTREQFDATAESIEGLEGSATEANVKMADDFHRLQIEVGASLAGISLDLARPVLSYISAHKEEIEADIKHVATVVKDDLGKAWDYLEAHQSQIQAGLQELQLVCSTIGKVIDVAAIALEHFESGLDKLHIPQALNNLSIGVGGPDWRNTGIGSGDALHDSNDDTIVNLPEGSGKPTAPAATQPTSQPVNVSVNFDHRDSVNQLAAKLHPILNRAANDLRNRFEGAAFQAAAQASMGGLA